MVTYHFVLCLVIAAYSAKRQFSKLFYLAPAMLKLRLSGFEALNSFGLKVNRTIAWFTPQGAIRICFIRGSIPAVTMPPPGHIPGDSHDHRRLIGVRVDSFAAYVYTCRILNTYPIVKKHVSITPRKLPVRNAYCFQLENNYVQRQGDK